MYPAPHSGPSTQPMTSHPNNAPTFLYGKGASIQREGRAALLRRHSSLMSSASGSDAPVQPDPPSSGAEVDEQRRHARCRAPRQTGLNLYVSLKMRKMSRAHSRVEGDIESTAS